MPDSESQAAEKAVVQKAIAGDPAAFTEIYSRHVTAVYRYIYYLVNDRAETEDLASQTFLNAWANIRRYRERGVPIVAWLFRIARNLTIAHLKRHRRLVSLDAHDLEAMGPSAESPAKAVTDRMVVRHAISLLPPTQQQVIVLRFAEEMSYSEVAGKIGKTEGAVRVIQYRALRKLAEILEPKEYNRNAELRQRRQAGGAASPRPA